MGKKTKVIRNGLANCAAIMGGPIEARKKRAFDLCKRKKANKSIDLPFTFSLISNHFNLFEKKGACRTGTLCTVHNACTSMDMLNTSGLNCNVAWSICNSILLLPYDNDDDTYHATTPNFK